MIDNIFTYFIEVMGAIEEDALNATSPIQVRVMRVDTAVSTLAFNADQSGLIGLLRHLHQQGYLLLSLYREQLSEEKNEPGNHNSREGNHL